MCYHIISTVFRAESCKQLAACLFCGKIWWQYLILFKFITFSYLLLSHNHRLNDSWWPFFICTLASDQCYHITSASHNTLASNRCSLSQDVLFSFFISWYCRPFAGAQYLTNDVSSAMCKTSIPAACQEGSVPSSSLLCRFRSGSY